jgi:hypothetical protein
MSSAALPIKQNREEAKNRLIAEWRSWAHTHPADTGADRMVFFSYVEREKPELLSFRCSGARWLLVNAWLQRANVLS